MADSLYRQWVMLRLLPREPRSMSTREIWQRLCGHGYSVTKRTVERDLDALSGQFGYTNETREGASFWFWPKTASVLDVPALDPATALAFGLIQDHLSPLLPEAVLGLLTPHFAAASQTLDRAEGSHLANWRKKVRVLTRGPILQAPVMDAEVQRAVTESLLAGHQIMCVYRSRTQEAEMEIRLHPLAMVVREGVFYLLATAWDFADIRQYALHRFKTVRGLAAAAAVSRGFSIDEYLRKSKAFSYPTELGIVKLVLLIDRGVAEHLRERGLSPDQTIEPAERGWSRLSASVSDSQELRWWILGMGGNVKVLKPAKLAKEIARSLSDARNLYRQ